MVYHHSNDRSERHSIFATFITNTLLASAKNEDEEDCCSETDIITNGPVLDVAGGKGHLSTALRELGQTSVLIDPCAETGRGGTATQIFYPPTAPTSTNNICQEVGGLPPTVTTTTDPQTITDPTAESIKTTTTTTTTFPSTLKMTLSDAITTQYDLVEKSSCIVGLHPDEVTEQIVTTALLHQKPFAIIPCCVLAHLFRHRSINNKQFSSKTIKKLGSFLSYLQSLDYRIQKTTLPFPGRNIVLYMTASDYRKSSIPPPMSSSSFKIDIRQIESAAKHGNIELLIQLHTQNDPPVPLTEECCQAAAWSGHLDTIQWLRNNDCPWDVSTCEGAFLGQSWNVLQYAIENQCPGYENYIDKLPTRSTFDDEPT